MNFTKRTCIFDSFIIPDNNDWAWEMKKEKDKQFKKDVEDIMKLIDKYSK